MTDNVFSQWKTCSLDGFWENLVVVIGPVSDSLLLCLLLCLLLLGSLLCLICLDLCLVLPKLLLLRIKTQLFEFLCQTLLGEFNGILPKNLLDEPIRVLLGHFKKTIDLLRSRG